MLDRHSLLSLSQYRNSEQPVISLYLNIDRQSSEARHLIQLKNMVTALEGQRDQYRTESWQRIQSDLDRIRDWVRDSYASGGTSLAVFACGDDLWRSYTIPYELQCRLFLENRVRLRPLYRLLQRFECYLTILAGGRDTSLCLVTPEGIREIERLDDTTPGHHNQGERSKRHQEKMVEAHLERVAGRAFRLFQEEQVDGIILMGTEARTARLAEQLHPDLREQLLARLPIERGSNLHTIRQESLKIGRARRRERQEDFLREWEDSLKGGRQGVAGLPDTLRAAQQGQLMALVMQEELVIEGGKCRHCRALTGEPGGTCDYCGGEIHHLDDVTEALITTAMDQGAELIFLPTANGFNRLTDYGGVGATLRYAAT